MRKRPFLLLACMFVTGILAKGNDRWWLLPFAIGLYFYARFWKDTGARKWLLGLGMPLMLVAGMMRIADEQDFRQQYLLELYDGQEVRLVGEIERIEEKSRCIYYYLTDCTMEQSGLYVPCNEVVAYASSDDFSIGQILVIRGTISLFDMAVNEGGFDARTHYQSQKIDFGVWVNTVEAVYGKGSAYRNGLRRIRLRLADSIANAKGKDGVLSAMLLGEKSALDGDIQSLYQRAGIRHILAISGLHVSLLGIGLYHLLRRCRLSYCSACTITAAFMISYALMTGCSVSTLRAIGMLMVCLAADLFGYSYDMLSALGFVVLVLLWENPFLLWYSGFVFSVVAVLGVGVTGPVLTRSLLGEPSLWEEEGQKKNRAASFFQSWNESLLVSIGIQLTTLPLVAYYYYEIPVYAILVNTVVLAVVKYFLGLGGVAAVVGLCASGVAGILMRACNWILDLYEWVCQMTLAWPGAQIITGFPGMKRMCLYYVCLGCGLYVIHSCAEKRIEEGEQKQNNRKRRAVGIVLFALCLLAILFLSPKKSFEMDVLDVGQGDGIYVCTSDGTTMFVDGGSTDVKQVGKYRMLPFLKYKGIKQISYWFVSHTDEDHVSGLYEVLESGYPVEYLVFSEMMRTDEDTKKLAELAQRYGTQILYMDSGSTLVTPCAKMHCLYPDSAKQTYGNTGRADKNDSSMVLLFEEKEFRAIFTGDISFEAEQYLLQQDCCKPVDFYKAAHHGSNTSNSYAFLKALQPSVAVVSCGAGNHYGHPGETAVANMESVGAKVFYTMEGGRIRIRKNRRGEVVVEKLKKQKG